MATLFLAAYKFKEREHFAQRFLHGEVPLRHLRVLATMQVLYAVLAVSLVFGGGSAPRTGALCFQPLAQR
jgi:hypothetical protein